MSSLRGQSVLITGGGTGIGSAIALELAGAGARLALMGRRCGPLEATASEIRAVDRECMVLPGDVRSFDQVERVVEYVVAEYGRLDVMVASAALVDHDPIDRANPAAWEALISTNVLGVLYAVRAVLPVMYSQRQGDIVIVASVSGRTTYVGEPAYVASKHATIAFADCLRKEVVETGVRVTVIEPGLVDTPFIDWESVRSRVPGVEPLRSEDCARVVRFALEQPRNCNISEIVLRPLAQVI